MTPDLLVQIAPGADLTSDLTGRRWTDVTQYARKQVSINPRGRPDEASDTPPARCSLRLDNAGGRWVARNPLNPWYPDLHRNTPLRVRLRRARDTFDRSVSNGLGTSTSGQVWTPATGAASAWSVGSTVAQVSISAVNSARTILLGAILLDAEQRSTITPLVAPTGGALVWQHMHRYRQAANTYHGLSVELNPGGTVTCKLRVQQGVSGGVVTSVTVPALTYTVGQPVHFRSGVFGQHYAAKAWVGTPDDEPHGWHLESDYYAITTPGQVGFQASLAVGNTNVLPYGFTVDNYELLVDRFTGFFDELPVSWAPGETDTYVDATASGLTRRLNQGKSPASAMRRTIGTTNPIAYWPLEDESSATQGASGLPTGAPILIDWDWGTVRFAGSTGPPGSGSLPEFASGGTLVGSVPADDSATSWRLEFVTKFPPLDPATGRIAVGWTTGGSVSYWEIFAAQQIDGGLSVNYETPSGGFGTFSSNVGVDDGEWHLIRAEASQSGGNIALNVKVDGVTVITQTMTTQTLGGITQVTVNPTGEPDDEVPAIGHIAVWAPWSSTADTVAAFRGYAGETASARMVRLCAEDGIPNRVDGAGDSLAMGPQPSATLLPLLQECAETDGGILYERTDGTIGYLSRVSRYNRPADWALTYGQLVPGVKPTDDDQQIRNDVTASRSGGSSAQRDDPDHIAIFGRYDDRISVNPATDEVLVNQAGWAVHVGTTTELRYPSIGVNLINQDSIIDGWLCCDVGSRLTVSGPPAILVSDSIDQIIEGYSETLDSVEWRVTINGVPAGSWDVAEATDIPAAGGDDSRQRRPAKDSALGTGGLPAGALSYLLTSTVTNGLWTTNIVDFYPRDDRIGDPVVGGGEKVRVAVPGQVLNDHPWLDAGTTGWVGSNATIAASTAQQRDPLYGSLLITPDGTSASGGANAAARVAVTVGQTYRAGAWVYSPGGHSDLRPAVDWYTATSGGSFISSSLGSAFVVPAGVWTWIEAIYTAPATAVGALMRVRHGNTPAASAVWYATQIVLIPTSTYTASPQTMTIPPGGRGRNGATRSWVAGTPVNVWRPAVAPL